MSGKQYYERDGGTLGEKFAPDPTWQGYVPSEHRKFRDKFCGLFFLLCVAGMGIISAVSIHNGDISLLDKEHRSKVTDDFKTLKDDRYVILVASLCTAVLGFLWLFLLKKWTKALVYASLFFAVGCLFAAGISIFALGFKDSTKSPTIMKIAGVVVMLVAVGCLLAIYFLRKRIAFSAAVIEQGCRGLSDNISLFTVVVPLVLLLTMGFLFWWVVTVIYLFAQKGHKVECPQGQQCPDEYQIDDAWRWAMLFMVFMFFWGSLFFAALARCTFAGGLAMWYFARNKVALPMGNSLRAFGWSLTYHLGTLAKGSALVALFRFINWCLDVARREQQNAALRCVLCLVQCICSCIEGMVRFVTRYAFIYAAMHGKDFVDSCREVSQLFNRCSVGQLFLNDVIVQFVVRLGIAAGVGVVTLGSTWYMHNHDGLSGSGVCVLIAVCVVVFFIIGLAIEVATDTVIVCYMDDDERNAESRDFVGGDVYMAIRDAAEKHSLSGNASKAKRAPAQTYGAV